MPAWLLDAIPTAFAGRMDYIPAMSTVTAALPRRDFRIISLIGVAHGSSHYYQLAFITMLLIVRDSPSRSPAAMGCSYSPRKSSESPR